MPSATSVSVRDQVRVEVGAGVGGGGAVPGPTYHGRRDLDAAEELVGVRVVDPGELVLGPAA